MAHSITATARLMAEIVFLLSGEPFHGSLFVIEGGKPFRFTSGLA